MLSPCRPLLISKRPIVAMQSSPNLQVKLYGRARNLPVPKWQHSRHFERGGKFGRDLSPTQNLNGQACYPNGERPLLSPIFLRQEAP